MTDSYASYETWHRALRRLSVEQELEYLVSLEEGAHGDAFRSGLSPQEELSTLEDMAEWRGCGCGGGGG